jgi:hypothetical protein
MKNILQLQRGMTVLGIFILLGMFGCFLLFGLTASPLYNEYITVQSGMKSVLSRIPSDRKTTKQVRRVFLKNMEMNNVERFNDITVKEYVNVKKSKNGKKKYLNVKFQASNKLFDNMYLMMDVDETIELTGKVSE